ncbi:MAG: helix-loop-helix DNA-binding domain-containing protein [Benjaminiella poitrasii]|nr:MAG: helix-loop-helix DNA-binding domain-containing protein [Benjaminiella poitrasii]
MPQQHNDSSFETFDWCFKQQPQQRQPQQQEQQPPIDTINVHTPSITPGANPSSNQHSPRSDYFYSAPQQNSNSSTPTSVSSRFNINQQYRSSLMIKGEDYGYNNTNYNLSDTTNTMVPATTIATAATVTAVSAADITTTTLGAPTATAMAVVPDSIIPQAPLNNSGLATPMSDVIFPGTPQSHNSIQSSSDASSPSTQSEPPNVSPSLDTPPPLSNAYAAIEKWGKFTSEEESSPKEDYHETRYWRKTKRSDSNSSNTTNLIAAAVAAVSARTVARTPIETGRQLKKVAHNAIERRYRNNINDRIRDLKNVVPALYKAKIREKKRSDSVTSHPTAHKSEEDDEDDEDDDNQSTASSDHTGEIIDGVEVAKKLNKATILLKATEYIHHLKHTNEMAERENQVLQQILAQMPGGAKVLARFQVQKHDFQQAEQQRMLEERKELQEREKAERQRMLRERAAQRAALAELLPKPERRPYRRRAKKQEKKQQGANKTKQTFNPNLSSSDDNLKNEIPAAGSEKSSLIDTSGSGNKAFMTIFLCLAIVSPLSFQNTAAKPYYSARAISQQQQQVLARSLPAIASTDYWYLAKIGLFVLLSACLLFHYWVQARRQNSVAIKKAKDIPKSHI